MEFIRANIAHTDIIAGLALLLWNDNTKEDLEQEFTETLQRNDSAVFLCFENSVGIGFAQFSLRSDYVEGTDTRPVGYLEGIFVIDEYRHRGIAKTLLSLGEKWAKAKGCRQMASDCELDNTTSYRFHMGSGFQEANRVICFVKDIQI